MFVFGAHGRTNSRVALFLMLVAAMTSEGVHGFCYRRFMSDRCDSLRGNEASDFQNSTFLTFGQEQYNPSSGKFHTNVTYSGTESMQISNFCALVNSNSKFQTGCLGVDDQTQDFVHPGDKFKITGNCSRNDYSNPQLKNKITQTQLADALRAFDRAMFYNAVIESHNPEHEVISNVTFTADLPLLTENSNFAMTYANDSLKFLLYSSRQPMRCVSSWNMHTHRAATGIWRVVFNFIQDRLCLEESMDEPCENGWTARPPDQAWACEGGFCYERAPCTPATCPINHFGPNCEPCPEGTFSLTPGAKAKQLSQCFKITDAGSECQQIVDLKLGQCSSEITPQMKRLTSLVLDVECFEEGHLRLTWGESIKTVSNNQEVFDFIKAVFGVNEDEFTLQFVSRGIEEDRYNRRRLLQANNKAQDESATFITYTKKQSAATSSSESSKIKPWVVVAIVAPLSILLIGVVVFVVNKKRSENRVQEPVFYVHVFS